MENPSIEFTLSGSFIVSAKSHSAIPLPSAPDAFDSSPISEFIKENLPRDYLLRTLFGAIENDHKTIKDLYLTARDVFIIPGVAPATPFERIAFVRKLLANTLSDDELRTTASGHSKIVVPKMPKWEKFVVSLALRHFNKLIRDGFYKSEPQRSAFIQEIFSMFEPVQRKDVRLVTPVELKKGKLSVRNNKEISLVVYSEDEILAMAGDLLSWPGLTFDAKSSIFDNVLTITSKDSEQQVQLQFTIPRETLRSAIWRPACPTVSSTKAAIDSFRGYYNRKMTGGDAASLARIVTSLDTSFILSLYQSFSNDFKVTEPIIQSLLTLFTSESNEIQLLKTVAYYELAATKSVNEIFRRNNNYFRTLVLFMNRATEKYKRTVVRELYDLLTAGDDWSFDNPGKEDVGKVEELLDTFLSLLISKIDQIPATLKTFCRYLRLLSERMFKDRKLNHRAVFALFILRFLCPALTTPSELGLEDAMPNKKVLNFNKLLVYACQFQHIDCEHYQSRAVLNLVIDKMTNKVIDLYEKLCVEVKYTGTSITRDQVEKAAATLRDYIRDHETDLLHKGTQNRNSHLFVDELLCEFITQCQ